jgi:glucokinase
MVPRLIADIGGTNARFALIAGDATQPYAERVLACADFPDPVAAIEHYLVQVNAPRPLEAAIAIATPITGDRIKMTNHVWSFSIKETRQRLGLKRLLMLNDFTALAMSLPYLRPEELHQVGSGQPLPGTPIALIGPGTGLGMSGLVPAGDRWIPLQGEGGHATFSPANDREIEILRAIRRQYSHVSTERLVSGMGLVNLYQAIALLEGTEAQFLTPPDITERGTNGTCPLCLEALQTFCGILGTAAGNLVLALGATAGVYIGGGIVPRLGDFFDASPFRQRFEQKGRFSAYLAAVPSYVIRSKYPALIGAAQAFTTY